jgi:CRP-like cAMP-binding protein
MLYKKGDMIGETDAILGELRDCKAVAVETCVLYIL